MGAVSKFAQCLPEGYGYVIFTAVGSTFVNMWLAINVSRARKQYEVEYPDMYSATSKTFNCIQRAHQSFLEGYPKFLFILFVGGLQYPKITTGAGVVYLLGRIVFAKGYYTGDPSKRKWGAFLHAAELVLMGNTIAFACSQLGWSRKCPMCK